MLCGCGDVMVLCCVVVEGVFRWCGGWCVVLWCCGDVMVVCYGGSGGGGGGSGGGRSDSTVRSGALPVSAVLDGSGDDLSVPPSISVVSVSTVIGWGLPSTSPPPSLLVCILLSSSLNNFAAHSWATGLGGRSGSGGCGGNGGCCCGGGNSRDCCCCV